MVEPSDGLKSPGVLGEFARLIKAELGDNDDLLKQCISDLNSLDRQTNRNIFEARMEYIRQRGVIAQIQFNGLKDYGLQTLRWLFLLNAGAIGVVLAYTGKSFGGYVGVLAIALLPFAVGCMFVVFAGLFGFLNFSYYEAAQPSPEQLHGFMNPESKEWPKARFQNENETGADFDKRFGWKVRWSRYAAIISGCASAVSFALGVGLVSRLVP